MPVVNTVPSVPLNGLTKVVRPTLIAAIGGTGTAAAKSAKERVEHYVGTKQHYVAVRAFDTDNQDDHTPRLIHNSEFVYLGGFNAQSVCQDVIDGKGFPHLSQWLPPWLDFQQVACGAGGIRPIGRLSYFYRRDRIETAIRDALTSIRDGDKALRFFQETGMQVNIDAGIDIHLICSLCGGTGSGMFLDLAFDLRRWAREFTDKEVTLTGHLVLPDAFRNKPVVLRSLEANCYAALQELDHYMNVSRGQEWRVEYQPGNVLVSEYLPFDYCYLLSGLQQGGSMDIEGLTIMIGEALFQFTSTEVGHRVAAGAINTNAQRRGTRDSRGRACCYSSYGALGIEIPSELLGRSFGSDLAKDARHHILQPAPRPDNDLDAQIEALLPSLGVSFEAVERLLDPLNVDTSPLVIMVNSGQQDAARAMLKSLLSQEHALYLQKADQRAARPICDMEALRAAVRKALQALMPQPSGFDRSLNFLYGVSNRLQKLRENLQNAARQAKEAADKVRTQSEAIEGSGLSQMKDLVNGLRPWEEYVRLESRRIVLDAQAFRLASHGDELRQLIERWQRIRTMFDHLRLERAISEDAYYANRRSRAPVCPLDWFNKLLEPFRNEMIQRVLAGLVEEFDKWSQINAAELSSLFYAICTQTMRDHFKGQAGMTCDQLLVDCYGYPSDRHKEIVASLISRARASWEVHETYAMRNNILEVAAIGVVPDSYLYETLKESHREISAVNNQWSDYIPVLGTAHILSLIGLKRLPAYRQSFADSINLDQRYDLHFFLDRRSVSDLTFPDDAPEDLDAHRWFTLAEAIGALSNTSGRYQFLSNGQPPVPLDAYRYLAFAGFRRNTELLKRAEDMVVHAGILLSSERIEKHINMLRNKIQRAAAAAQAGSRSVAGRRPHSREVQQIHQEIRAVLLVLNGSEGAL